MNVPADLRRRIEDEAAAMGVPPEWVLRACIEVAMVREDQPMLDLVIAVEAVRDDPRRVVRMPRYHRKAAAGAKP